MNTLVLIIVLVLVVLGGLVVLGLILGRAAKKRLEALGTEMRDTATAGGATVERIEAASLFGVASQSAAQNRGLGMLCLTDGELWFKPVAGTNEVHLARAAITGADTVSSFLGKAQAVPLLHVTFTDADDAGDEAAWRLADTAGWIAALTSDLPS